MSVEVTLTDYAPLLGHYQIHKSNTVSVQGRLLLQLESSTENGTKDLYCPGSNTLSGYVLNQFSHVTHAVENVQWTKSLQGIYTLFRSDSSAPSRLAMHASQAPTQWSATPGHVPLMKGPFAVGSVWMVKGLVPSQREVKPEKRACLAPQVLGR